VGTCRLSPRISRSRLFTVIGLTFSFAVGTVPTLACFAAFVFHLSRVGKTVIPRAISEAFTSIRLAVRGLTVLQTDVVDRITLSIARRSRQTRRRKQTQKCSDMHLHHSVNLLAAAVGGPAGTSFLIRAAVGCFLRQCRARCDRTTGGDRGLLEVKVVVDDQYVTSERQHAIGRRVAGEGRGTAPALLERMLLQTNAHVVADERGTPSEARSCRRGGRTRTCAQHGRMMRLKHRRPRQAAVWLTLPRARCSCGKIAAIVKAVGIGQLLPACLA
jgi:hypothetical protein